MTTNAEERCPSALRKLLNTSEYVAVIESWTTLDNIAPYLSEYGASQQSSLVALLSALGRCRCTLIIYSMALDASTGLTCYFFAFRNVETTTSSIDYSTRIEEYYHTFQVKLSSLHY